MAIQTKLQNLTLTIPTEVSEITLGQFLEMKNAPDNDIVMLSIISGVPVEDLTNLTYTGKTEREFNDITRLTGLLSTAIRDFNASPEKVAIPKKVTILGKNIRVPEELEEAPFWPSRVAKQTILENQQPDGSFDLMKDIDKILAHYLYVPYTGMTYNEARAEEFREIVKEFPFDTALQIGNFFLLKSAKFWMPKPKYWLEMYRVKKYRLVSKILKFLGMSTR